MNRLSTGLVAAGSLVAAGLCAGPALAAPDAVFVDPNVGLDGNPCTETSPCQTLAHAQTVVADPGTIIILSSGSLAPPSSIATSLTITCPGGGCIIDGSANFNGSAMNGVTISAGSTKSVALHNLSIGGYSTGLIGVSVTDVGRLELKGTSISGFGTGINFAPGTGVTSHLYVFNSEIRNSGTRNVVIAPTGSNSATAVFAGTKVHHANAGFVADATAAIVGGVSVVITDSVVAFTNNNAVLANGNGNIAQPGVRILIDRSDVSYSGGNCILANGFTATVTLTKTMVTQCGTALNPLASGTIYSYGDNAINFNTSNGSAPSTGGGFH
jgi:hypothetical protein